MKLLLCSYRLGHHGATLRRLAGGDRAALVFNALDQYDSRLREWPRETAELAAAGFEVGELDLRDHFGDEDGLGERLRQTDVVWVVGGNTFVLARAMKLSGFKRAAIEDLEAGRLVYAGYSAGACITGPDLEGIHLMDDAAVVPPGYPSGLPTETLGWLPYRIVPHWRSDHAETDSADLAVDHLLANGLVFRTLRDGEAIVVDDDGEDD